MIPLPFIDSLVLEKLVIEEKKQYIGNAIYPCIQSDVGEHAGKITGMLLDEKVVDLKKLVTEQKYLNDLVFEALRLLQE